MKRLIFTVTNDLVFDQRMHRICSTLSQNGFKVTLVGRKLPGSRPLTKKNYRQVRLNCFNKKGKWFYTEYNLRLYFFLLFQKMDAICAIDLDTIIPCYKISALRKIPRIYDAHELFTEMKEVITRPGIRKIWTSIERRYLPRFKYGYTVSEGIADEFRKRYNVHYETIRNLPLLEELGTERKGEKYILYQGAVNEGRGFEWLIPAMQHVNYNLVICGDGNFMRQLKKLIAENRLENKIELKGMLTPAELKVVAQGARAGIALAEKQGLNQWLALPNKFLDYIHAGLPQVTMNYPEYKKINVQYEVAILLDELEPREIAGALNNLCENDVVYERLRKNTLLARQKLNWQNEEKKLLAFYAGIFQP